MTKTERDNTGKLRIAKGDKSGLGGQYAPDIPKRKNLKEIDEFVNSLLTPGVQTPTIQPNIQYLTANLKARAADNINDSQTKEISELLYHNFNTADTDTQQTILNMTPQEETFWKNQLTEEQQHRINTAKIVTDKEVDILINSYVGSSIWTDVESDTDKHYTIFELAEESRNKTLQDVRRFISQNPQLTAEALNNENYTVESFGHDLWMTRTGQGVGFWDREELSENNLGEKLTQATHATLPAVSLVESDNNKLYFE